MKTQALIEHATALYYQMEPKVFDDGETRVIIKDDGDNHQELVDLTFKVSEETNLSMDSVYLFTLQALDIIGDANETELTEDNIQELSSNIEADVYTGDLTEWLSESDNHVSYLTAAIEQGVSNGFDALTVAQVMAKVEVFDIVCRHLLDRVK